jgi:uncharacterized protein YggE
MKKTVLAAFIFSCVITGLKCQTYENPAKPYIEVTGTSDTEITPDEIYITITLQERMENKEKLLIEKQEQDLKQNLKELGIDIANITLNNFFADYQKIKSNKKDVINSKSYTLKVGSADMVSKVYERLDRINAHDAYISKLTHSKILDYTKENRIKAIKAAKEKAEYLLTAVGKQSGTPLQILETNNVIYNPLYDNQYTRGARASNTMQMLASVDNPAEDASEEISIKKIKISSSFLVKYEILNR